MAYSVAMQCLHRLHAGTFPSLHAKLTLYHRTHMSRRACRCALQMLAALCRLLLSCCSANRMHACSLPLTRLKVTVPCLCACMQTSDADIAAGRGSAGTLIIPGGSLAAGAIDGSSIRHTKGCNCKKSGCLKKYCECFQAGITCSEMCKCMDCKNFEVRSVPCP